jgi:nucleotide-binding universal stress UspA family protein
VSGPALIAYDGSEDAAAAVTRAGALLTPREALVVCVWQSLSALLLHTDVEGLTGTMREAAEELDAEDAQEARRIAAEGAELARAAGFTAEPRALRGRPKPWRTLVDEAESADAAVIVSGRRGLGAIASGLLGSVSSGLLNHARRPLLVVPAPEDDGPGPLIAGHDGSEASHAALAAAARLLTPREALIETVWTPYAPVAAGGVAGAPSAVIARAAAAIDREIAAGARRTAEEGARFGAARGLETRPCPVQGSGNVWRTLIDSARERRAAAIVVGSRGQSAVAAALLGSVSTGLVHHSPVPVLVVPPPEG